MFSYTMLATSPLFCYPDWPRRFFARFPALLRAVLPFTSPDPQPSTSCVYRETHSAGTEHQETPPVAKPSKLRLKHKLRAIFTILYIIEQFFLPYSHFITKVHLPLMFCQHKTDCTATCSKKHLSKCCINFFWCFSTQRSCTLLSTKALSTLCDSPCR